MNIFIGISCNLKVLSWPQEFGSNPSQISSCFSVPQWAQAIKYSQEGTCQCCTCGRSRSFNNLLSTLPAQVLCWNLSEHDTRTEFANTKFRGKRFLFIKHHKCPVVLTLVQYRVFVWNICKIYCIFPIGPERIYDRDSKWPGSGHW